MSRKDNRSEAIANEFIAQTVSRPKPVLQAGDAFATPGPKRVYPVQKQSLFARVLRAIGF